MRQAVGGLLAVAVSLCLACGGDAGGSSGGGGSTVAPSTSGLVGTWKATRAEFVNTTNSSQRVEIVSMGTSLTLALDVSGSYTQKIVDPGQAGQTTSGRWTSTKDTLALTPGGMTWQIEFDMTLSGSTLTLNGGHVAFDVNVDGKDEETLAYFTLVRQ
jgi:hypothetical protein